MPTSNLHLHGHLNQHLTLHLHLSIILHPHLHLRLCLYLHLHLCLLPRAVPTALCWAGCGKGGNSKGGGGASSALFTSCGALGGLICEELHLSSKLGFLPLLKIAPPPGTPLGCVGGVREPRQRPWPHGPLPLHPGHVHDAAPDAFPPGALVRLSSACVF